MRHGLTPDQAERVLGQRAGSEDPSLRALERFVSDLRSEFATQPDASTRAAHLAAMAGVSPEAASAPARQQTPRRGLRGMIAAFGLAFVGASAMAATGTLPDVVQDGVADSVALMGVDIAGGSDEVDTKRTPKNPRAAANKERSDAYTDAKKAWTACVGEAAKSHEGPEPFAPEEACGEKPNPHDFGIPAKDENAKKDKPANANKPEKAPRPEKPEKPDDPSGQGGPPKDAGPPEHANAPDHAGPPNDAGASANEARAPTDK